MDTLKSGQPPYNGHTFLPLKKGQPLNNELNACPKIPQYKGSKIGVRLIFEWT